MPTFMVFKNGNKVEELLGAEPRALEVRIFNLHRDEPDWLQKNLVSAAAALT